MFVYFLIVLETTKSYICNAFNFCNILMKQPKSNLKLMHSFSTSGDAMNPAILDEAPRDPGARMPHHSYTDKDFEGKTIFVV